MGTAYERKGDAVMEIINLSRGGGKTTALVYASAVDRIPILCLNSQNKKYIKDLANRLGVKIPEPLTCNPSDVKKIGYLGLSKILIDNAEFVIPTLIEELTGAEVRGMTMSIPMNYPANATQKGLSHLQREDRTKSFDEAAEELMNTIKMRSFNEAAEDAAKHLAETLKNFGFSVN